MTKQQNTQRTIPSKIWQRVRKRSQEYPKWSKTTKSINFRHWVDWDYDTHNVFLQEHYYSMNVENSWICRPVIQKNHRRFCCHRDLDDSIIIIGRFRLIQFHVLWELHFYLFVFLSDRFISCLKHALPAYFQKLPPGTAYPSVSSPQSKQWLQGLKSSLVDLRASWSLLFSIWI